MKPETVALPKTFLSAIPRLMGELSLLAWTIVLVIIGAFLAGMWTAFRMWRRLQREDAALQEVQGRCRRLQEIGRTQDMNVAEFLTVDVQPASAIICTRVHDLQTIRDKGGDVSREALAAAAVARLSLDTSLLRYIMGILILIGLMGTLVGLTQAVIGLSTHQLPLEAPGSGATPKPGDASGEVGQRILHLYKVVANLFESVGQTLTGMRTAFFASLVAIALTLVLSFYNHLLQNRQTQFSSPSRTVPQRI